MEPVTLETAVSKLSELAALIDKLKAAAAGQRLHIPETTIDLQPGERYAGPVLDADGRLMHHLVLLPHQPDADMTWGDAMHWAESVGGELPTRQEQALLFANCKPHLKAGWHWSSQTYETDASYAWSCYFVSGSQDLNHKSYEGCARAVRRFNPSVL